MSRKRLVLVSIILFLLFIPNIIKYVPQDTEISVNYHDRLLNRWSPVIYQETQKGTSNSYLDKLTSIDYDGDLDTSNNWDNLEDFKDTLPSTVYAWSKETTDRYYLGYGIYHPRDWSPNRVGIVHENDFEGLILEIEKDNTRDGKLVSLITIAHMDLLHYNLISFETFNNVKRPIVYVESGGHGVYGNNITDHNETTSFIKYIPENENFDSANRKTTFENTLNYNLSSINWLWLERENESLFTNYGFFQSDRSGSCSQRFTQVCTTNVASPPWRWSQGQDFPGQIWFEPEIVFGMF